MSTPGRKVKCKRKPCDYECLKHTQWRDELECITLTVRRLSSHQTLDRRAVLLNPVGPQLGRGRLSADCQHGQFNTIRQVVPATILSMRSRPSITEA